MLKTNETRSIKWHETCKCICRLNEIIGNYKQRWNKDKYRCECKQLINKEVCDKGFIWNPSNSECECDKSCNIGQYLDYSDCKCKKKLIDPLIEECTENNDEAKLVNITLAENENNYGQFLQSIYYTNDNSFYNFYWNYYLFCLLQLALD